MGVLIVVSAIAILVATLWLPVLRIYGTSMTPTLKAGDIVLTSKGSSFNTGDVVAFYYNNKILVKRVIAGPGDWVYIDDDGNVFVNGEENRRAIRAGKSARRNRFGIPVSSA